MYVYIHGYLKLTGRTETKRACGELSPSVCQHLLSAPSVPAPAGDIFVLVTGSCPLARGSVALAVFLLTQVRAGKAGLGSC